MNKTLAPLSDSPKCVSSLSGNEQHAINPLHYNCSLERCRHALLGVVAGQKRSTIIANYPCYIHAEFRSALFGFVDDVEFLFGDKEGIIHCRSASRSGHYDFGVNRRRIERIRKAFNKSLR